MGTLLRLLQNVRRQQRRPRFCYSYSSFSSSSSTASDTKNVSFLQEMYRAILPSESSMNADSTTGGEEITKRRGAIRGASEKARDIETSTVTDMAVIHDSTSDQEKNSFFKSLLKNNPIFQKVNQVHSSTTQKFQDMHEKYWETSDSPLVHRIQDAIDDSFIMQESEAQISSREIRSRDPTFDMVDFLRRLKDDVPVVIQAYLNGHEDTIKEYCSPEMIERLTGIIKAQKESGLVPDPTLLDTSEVELVDLKMLEDSPIIVVQFTCQQINCTRDTHGNVVEGGPEDVQRVYYYWALQQEETGFVGVDGKLHPPRWQLREMLIRGMHNLL